MTEEIKNDTALQVVTNTQFISDVSIDKNDIVGVAVACEEERLKDFLKSHTGEHGSISKQIGVLTVKISGATSKFKDEITKAAKAKDYPFMSSLKAAGFKPVVDIEWNSGSDSDKKFGYKLRLGDENGYRNLNSKKAIEVAVPKEIVADRAAMAKLYKDLGILAEKIREARLKLADLASVERKAKAKLTIATMQQSESGRKILAAMQGVGSTSKLLLGS